MPDNTQPAARSAGPGPLRACCVIAAIVAGVWVLAGRGDSGVDENITKLGRVELTARLLERPDAFPDLGAYRYTYVLKYEVLKVHRQDPSGRHTVRPGDVIFVGHYKPWMPRGQIRDADWGQTPLGGRLNRFVAGQAHRMALDYDLADLAPSGTLDYCFPAAGNRFFAVWTNPADL